MKLEPGQVAVVTGAASGIGLALTEAFTWRGLTIGMADIAAAPLEREAARLTSNGARVVAVVCDVQRLGAVEALRDAVLRRFGRIDVICNNAGVMLPFKPLWQTTAEEWNWIVDVNLRGVFNGIRAFLPRFVAQGYGHVVNTASMAGVTVIAGNGPYNATKHAVVSLTETLQADLAAANSGVGATVLCCGRVQTNIRQAAGQRDTIAPPLTATAVSEVLEATEIASRVMEAIEEKRLYLFTNRGSEARIRQRVDRLLADLPSRLRCAS